MNESKKNFNTLCNLIDDIDDKDFLEEERESSINEVIRHFSKLPTRRGESQKRYIYNRKDLNRILSSLEHPEYVKVEEEKDDCGDIFCFTLSFAKLLNEPENSKTSA